MSSVFKKIIYIIAFFCLLLQVKAAENITLRNYVSPNTSKFQVKPLLFHKPTLPFAFVQQVNAPKKHASYQYSFPKSQLTSDPNIEESRISYALCEPNSYKEKHCKIVLRDLYKNNEETFCNITLKAERESGNISTEILTKPFGKNRVIFVYKEDIEEENGKDAIMNFNSLRLNDCKISETKILMDTRTIIIFENLLIRTNKDSYTIYNPFFCGMNLSININDDCQINFNDEGKLISPMHFDSSVHNAYIIPLPPNYQSLGNLILNTSNIYEPRNATLYFQDNKGLKVWKHFEFDQGSNEGSVILFSSAHNTVVICSSAKVNINCTSFDLEGNIKLETAISSSWEPPFSYGFPYPLSNDRFLLLVVENFALISEELENGTCLDYRLYVKKFDADGKESFLPLVSNGKLDYCLNTVEIFENNIGEYCVSQMCTEDYETSIKESYDMRSRIDCFTEEDIKYSENDVFYQCNV